MPRLSRLITGAVGLSVLLSAPTAQAQVRPDRTTNTERIGNCSVACDIRGGIESDRNLFHSFQSFSIPTDGAVYFLQRGRIRNVFVRVTGREASTLDGFLFVGGIANFFLMNPNGVLFGENASINVGDSFIATTADAIAFEDGGIFDARRLAQSTDPQLLSVNPSAFLFHNTPAPLAVQSGSSANTSLQVFGNSTLLFLGGEITVDNAFLSAVGGGSIQFIGLGEPGTVGYANHFPFVDITVPEDLARADVTVNASQIDVQSNTRGEIVLDGRNLWINGSFLFAGIDLDLGFRGARSGDITLSATERVAIDSFSILANNLSTGATGNSGNVIITAHDFSLLGGSQIDTSTYGRGNAGSVVIDVANLALLQGTTLDGRFASAILSETSVGAIGNGGDISIHANELQVLNGAQLSTSTESEGNAGNIRIEATDRVVFDGRSANNRYVSIAFSDVTFYGLGDGGNLRIETGDLFVTNGASLVASTDGIGNAGRIIIRARDTATFSGTAALQSDDGFELVSSGIFNRVEPNGIGDAGTTEIVANDVTVADGARVTSASLGVGNAGNVLIRAQDSVLLDAARVQTNSATSLSGRGGDIRIEADRLALINAAQVISASEGVDRAGDVVLDAREIELDTGAVIAATLSQDGGGLTIQGSELLLLRNNALLSTRAGLDEGNGGGNGGNIAIASDLIVGVPVENSNISADAFGGNGGNVDIVTQGLFGIEFRDRSTPLSDITASSEFGIAGEVTITNPAIDPTSGLIELPSTLVDASTQLRQDCRARSNPSARNAPQGEFIVTGRGGLPAAPGDTSSRDAVQSSWISLPDSVESGSPQWTSTEGEPVPVAEASLVEAQAWTFDAQGRVVLTAETPTDPTVAARCLS